MILMATMRIANISHTKETEGEYTVQIILFRKQHYLLHIAHITFEQKHV